MTKTKLSGLKSFALVAALLHTYIHLLVLKYNGIIDDLKDEKDEKVYFMVYRGCILVSRKSVSFLSTVNHNESINHLTTPKF